MYDIIEIIGNQILIHDHSINEGYDLGDTLIDIDQITSFTMSSPKCADKEESGTYIVTIKIILKSGNETRYIVNFEKDEGECSYEIVKKEIWNQYIKAKQNFEKSVIDKSMQILLANKMINTNVK